MRLFRLLILFLLLAAVAACTNAQPSTEAAPVSEAGPARPILVAQEQAILLGETSSPETLAELARCERQECFVRQPKWSPDGTQVLYLDSSFTPFTADIMVAGRDGSTRTLASGAHPFFEAAWSPDGLQVAFIVETQDFMGSVGNEARYEVWSVGAAGGEPAKRGDVGFGTGCGGMTSLSERLYEAEGFLYSALNLAWGEDNVLLYTLNCGGAGVGRFSMETGEMLEHYAPTSLRDFTFDAATDRWAGIGENVIVVGDPGSPDYDVIEIAAHPSSAYFGSEGTLYYVTRQANEGALDTFVSTLWRYDEASGEHTQLWQSPDFAFANVQDDGAGNLFFTRVENDVNRAFEQLMNGATEAELAAIAPKKQVLRLSASGGEPTVFMEDAGSAAIP